MRIYTLAKVLPVLGLVVGCSTVPTLPEVTGTTQSDVLIRDIVRRVKCEIADAFIEKIKDPSYFWLQNWTAKVDLTLQVNSQGSISPSVSNTSFFKNAFNFAAGSNSLTSNVIGAVSQTFTFGASANYGEQAVRTEVVTFSLSVREIKDEIVTSNSSRTLSINNTICAPNDLPELQGGLDLRQWLDSALSPITYADLRAGDHPSPVTQKSQAPTSPIGKPPLLNAAAFGDELESFIPFWEAYHRLEVASATATKMSSNLPKRKAIKDANDNSVEIISIVSNSIRVSPTEWNAKQREIMQKYAPYYAVLTKHFAEEFVANVSRLNADLAEQKKSIAQYTSDEKNYAEARNDAFNKFRDISALTHSDVRQQENYKANLVTLVELNLKNAQSLYKFYSGLPAANLAALKELQASKLSPPVDALLHFVQFTVVYGGSISPNWSLINWKGPTLSGSLASVVSNRAHTLQISLGADPEEQKRLINNQLISSLPRTP